MITASFRVSEEGEGGGEGWKGRREGGRKEQRGVHYCMMLTFNNWQAKVDNVAGTYVAGCHD